MVKISLITVVYNRAGTIERTLQSVFAQSYPHIEYIVIDGASTDGTLTIIQSYQSRISYFLSEPDKGVYDALNKGICMATGDIIGILHADDTFADSDVLSRIAEVFNQQKEIDCLFGDVAFVRDSDPQKIIRYYSSSIFRTARFKIGIMPAHPTFYCKKKYFDQLGLYRTDLEITSDFDLLIRFLYKHKLRYLYLPQLMVIMNLGGKSTRGLNSTFKINRENRKVLKEHNIRSSYLHLYARYFIKIRELIFKKAPKTI